MITAKELHGARLVVGLKGAEVDCVDDHGEVRWSLGLQPGVIPAEKLCDLMGVGDTLTFTGKATLVGRNGRVRAQGFGAVEFESGANPLFQPTSATQAEIRLRNLVKTVNNAEKRIAKRQAALERAATLARAGSEDSAEGDVIEDPTPATAETPKVEETPKAAADE